MKQGYLYMAMIAVIVMANMVSPHVAQAFNPFPPNACDGVDCTVVKTTETALQGNVANIINTAIYILGGVSVLMVVIGGIRMAIANGDPGNIKAGKHTILWAIIGLVVALLSFGIVQFIAGWKW